MPLTIAQFSYSGDNLAYVIHGGSEALAIDPGAAAAIVAYLEGQGLTLTRVAHTHGHPDHTLGTREVMAATGADLIHPSDGSRIPVDGRQVRVMRAPGHTEDSVCFQADGALITGDLLFNGTVGNCSAAAIPAFYRSIRQVLALPGTTQIFAGHDYVHAAMAFARYLEPDNPHLDGYLANYSPRRVVSTLADERRVNPYLRFNQPAMVRALASRGLAVDTEFDRFASVMSLE